jgi:hypothetical protein
LHIIHMDDCVVLIGQRGDVQTSDEAKRFVLAKLKARTSSLGETRSAHERNWEAWLTAD